MSEETTQTVQANRYDTVFVDVLEHIEDDHGELRRAERALQQGGSVVVLSTSSRWLFSSFDEAIGRYQAFRQVHSAAMCWSWVATAIACVSMPSA